MKELIKNFDKKTFDTIIFTQKLAFFISIIGTIGLFVCLKFYSDIILYYASIAIFKTGLLASACSLLFGIIFNNIKSHY